MAKVICTLYGRYHDRVTGVEFRPELVDGRYVGVAEIEDAKVLKHFEGREGFEIVGGAKTEPVPNSRGTGRKARAAKAATPEE